MSIRAVVVLAAVLCAAPLTVPAAQQAPDSALAAVPASSTPVSAPSTPLPGPRLSPQFQRAEPILTFNGTSERSASSGQHTIVISTLVLVLAVIIIVLLVT